jgi:Transposase IS4
MSLYMDNEIMDYWNTKDMMPEYPITKYLSRNRFQELYIRMRFHRNQEQGPYEKVTFIFLSILPETS